MEPLYTAAGTATHGRDGRTRSADGFVDVPLAVPKEMGGPGGEGTNPEQLFAAGYAACFHGALLLAARQDKADVRESTMTAHVTIGRDDDGGLALAVEMVGSLPHLDKERAQALMDRAHQICPYSKATRGNIPVTLSVA
ncbi:MAG TPA: organic hydroperoxide resistance protein [Frankiaceae bacterium]|nr:organic hydroperoxide resistance protein [Frankiaceae bacterium]